MTRQGIVEMEDKRKEDLEWEDMEYAYAYEGVVLPGWEDYVGEVLEGWRGGGGGWKGD